MPNRKYFIIFLWVLISLRSAESANNAVIVFEQAKNSVLIVRTTTTGGMKKQGSGVYLGNDNVATNCHVLEGATQHEVGFGNVFKQAKLIMGDAEKDLCILRVAIPKAKAVRIGAARKLKVGEEVFAIGSPRGLELSISDGIVAQLRGTPIPIIQTTASISPGSSGGGLFNNRGELVGVTTFNVIGGQNLNFALPSEWLIDLPTMSGSLTKQRRAANWIIRAATLEESKNWKELVKLSAMWIEAEPNNAFPRYTMGIALLKSGSADKASKEFSHAIRLQPDFSHAWYYLGASNYELRRIDVAIEAYREAIKINPDYSEVWNDLGLALISVNKFHEGIDAHKRAIAISPRALFWKNLGVAYGIVELTRYKESNFNHRIDKTLEINAYREAAKLDPTDADTIFKLGMALTSDNRCEEANEQLVELRRLDPGQALEFSTWFRRKYGPCENFIK